VVVPADKVILPPAPLLPEPTVIDIDPPIPDAEVPEPINIEPLLLLLADPVLNTNIPLTPDTPALGVVSIILPLDEYVDDPEVIVTAPPLSPLEIAGVIDPADKTKLPPLPETPEPTVTYTEPP